MFNGKDQTETGAVLAENGQAETGQALVKEVAGEVMPTEKPSEDSESQAAASEAPQTDGTTQAAVAASSDASSGQTASPDGTSAQTPSAETPGEVAPATAGQEESAAPAGEDVGYLEYVVKSGDTLSLICKEHYGRGTPALVAEVCKFNGMANANLIYEGQVLKLPEQ